MYVVFTVTPLYVSKFPQSPTAYTFAVSILLAITEFVKFKKFNIMIANMIHTIFVTFFILYKLFSHPFLFYSLYTSSVFWFIFDTGN